MKKLIQRTGLEGKQTVFLFTDTQIIHESFLEVRLHHHMTGTITISVLKLQCYESHQR